MDLKSIVLKQKNEILFEVSLSFRMGYDTKRNPIIIRFLVARSSSDNYRNCRNDKMLLKVYTN